MYKVKRDYLGYVQEYNNIMLDKQKRFTNHSALNQDVVLEIMRYAFDYYLNWDPYDVRDNLNAEILDKLKLTRFMKYVEFPYELEKTRDFFYIAHLCYPNVIKYSIRDAVLRVYRKVLSGEEKGFFKNFFSDEFAEARAEICLQEMISKTMSFKSVRDMYKQFSEPEILKKLNNAMLLRPCQQLFITPLDYLHESLPDKWKNDFWYHYYQFEGLYRSCLPADRRKKFNEGT